MPAKTLYCPKCLRESDRTEWVRVRRFLGATKPGQPPVELLRHRICDVLAYSVVESS
jgi:hypothetical protein